MHSNSFLFIICGLLLAAVSIFAAPPAPSEPGTGTSKFYGHYEMKAGGEAIRPLTVKITNNVDSNRHEEFARITAGYANSVLENDGNHPLRDAKKVLISRVIEQTHPGKAGAVIKATFSGNKVVDGNAYFHSMEEPGHWKVNFFPKGAKDTDTPVEYHDQLPKPDNIPPPGQAATHNSPEQQRSRSNSPSSVSLGSGSDSWGKGIKRKHSASPVDGRKKRKTSTSPHLRKYAVGGRNRNRQTRSRSPSSQRSPSPGPSSYRTGRGYYDDRRGRGAPSPGPSSYRTGRGHYDDHRRRGTRPWSPSGQRAPSPGPSSYRTGRGHYDDHRGRGTRPWSPSGPRRAPSPGPPSPGPSSHRTGRDSAYGPQRGQYDRRGRGNNSPPPRRNYVGSSHGGQTRAAGPMRFTAGGGRYRDRRYSSRSRSRSRSPPSRYPSGNDDGRGQGTSSSGGAAQGHGGAGQSSNRDWVPNDQYTREHPRGP